MNLHPLINLTSDENELKNREKDLRIMVVEDIIKDLALSEPKTQE